MVKYQEDSLLLISDVEGQSARDRLTKIDRLSKDELLENKELKDKMNNNVLSLSELKETMNVMVSKMITIYKNYLNNNIRNLLKSNDNYRQKLACLYQAGNYTSISFEEFESIISEM